MVCFIFPCSRLVVNLVVKARRGGGCQRISKDKLGVLQDIFILSVFFPKTTNFDDFYKSVLIFTDLYSLIIFTDHSLFRLECLNVCTPLKKLCIFQPPQHVSEITKTTKSWRTRRGTGAYVNIDYSCGFS